MKRKMAILLTLALMMGLAGCEKQDGEISTEKKNDVVSEESVTEQDTEEVAGSEENTSVQEEQAEENTESVVASKVSVSFDGKSDDRYNENGDMILSVYYVHPVVSVADKDEVSNAIATEFENDEGMFFTNCESMETEAKLAFENGLMEDMPPYANEVRFTEKRVDDKVTSFVRSHYSNTGGNHGNNYASGWNFDVTTGKKLTIDDIAEDREAFMADVKEYVLALCESDAYKNRLFPDYEASIDIVLQDDLWYFDYEGITFISNPYELSAYAEGTLYFTVPYTELEGLKSEYTYDGGFQKSVSLGETIVMDLNGDGKDDEVTFQVEMSSDYVYTPVLTINGADYSEVFEKKQIYFDSPYEKYVILDVDASDDYLEIAVQDYGMSEDPMTAFLRYEGDKVTYLGTIYDRVSDLYIVNDGKGTLYARERMNIFETVNRKISYRVEDNKLVQNASVLYPIAYTDATAEKGLLQDLIVYKEMSTKSETVTLKKETEVIALATDNAEWVQIEYEDGEIYYIHVVDHYMIDMNGFEVDSRDVFTDIIQAG